MAARKLQTEIEKTLKKVAEGVEVFESIFDKINTSSNQTQKEKLEVDLKSQIKKLQRLRDQIKTWMQSNDIKDKQPLQDNRRLIETQMERFKACEKEMKTKAFSKEGLSATAKLDPKEQLKVELCGWIATMVDELSRQVEQTEAEIETLQVLKKKKDSAKGERLDELETINERRAWHVGRLELILRLLENGNLGGDEVSNVRDDIAYFVESNTEEDFEEDEGIYDDLNLQEEEDIYGLNNDDVLSSHDSASVADDSAPTTTFVAPPRTPAKEPTKPLETAPSPTSTAASNTLPTKPKAAPIPVPARKLTMESTARPPIIVQSTPTRTVSGSTAPASIITAAIPAARPVVTALPPIRYAAAAAAANVPSPSMVPAPSILSAPPGFGAPILTNMPPVTPSNILSTAAGDSSRQASTVSSPEMTKASIPVAQSGNSLMSSMASPAMSAASLNGGYSHSSTGPSAAPSVSSNSQSHVIPISPAVSSASLPAPPLPSSNVPGAVDRLPSATTTTTTTNEQRLPSSLADLVTSFESAKQKSMRRDNDLSSIHKILDAGYSNVPQPLDAEKPKYYIPRNPFQTPSYYPQEPSAQFGSAQLFSKFDVDTLFYIFYYCPGTYLQYLAASELKKQSWRFHKQYLTWFQRANEPQQITDEYEQGVYLYFDWEGSWCQRRKSDFKFEYRYLETE